MSTKFHELAISSVEQLTDDAVTIGFTVPDELKEAFAFVPGQYLTLRATVDGEDIRRSYSVCAPLGDDLRVGIKRVEKGRFSTFAQTLEAGDLLKVMQPEGRFTCSCAPENSRNLLLVAAGSGITPILSIAHSVLETEPHSIVTLVYGNRATGSIMFREALEDLKDRFLERFHVYHVLSRESQDVDLFSGRVDVDRIRTMTETGLIDPSDCDGIYLCGPSQMTLSLAEHFAECGISKECIHTELFEVAGEEKPTTISGETRQVVADGVNIEVVLDGIRRNFVLSSAEDTVLQAAERSGLDLPFSCAGGMCATCRCKVVEGDVAMDRNFSLDTWEVDAGFVLACQSRPKSRKLVLDFDAA